MLKVYATKPKQSQEVLQMFKSVPNSTEPMDFERVDNLLRTAKKMQK